MVVDTSVDEIMFPAKTYLANATSPVTVVTVLKVIIHSVMATVSATS